MPAIVRDAVDSRPYSFARDARLECKHGANRETFEVHRQMVLQACEVLHCPVCVHTTVASVPSTVQPEFRVIFVEACTPSFFVDASPVPSIR